MTNMHSRTEHFGLILYDFKGQLEQMGKKKLNTLEFFLICITKIENN